MLITVNENAGLINALREYGNLTRRGACRISISHDEALLLKLFEGRSHLFLLVKEIGPEGVVFEEEYIVLKRERYAGLLPVVAAYLELRPLYDDIIHSRDDENMLYEEWGDEEFRKAAEWYGTLLRFVDLMSETLTVKVVIGEKAWRNGADALVYADARDWQRVVAIGSLLPCVSRLAATERALGVAEGAMAETNI